MTGGSGLGLAERLIAAIDATEDIAREASRGPWMAGSESRFLTTTVVYTASEEPVCDLEFGTNLADGVHIARHDPAAVLRRCAADRKIVELHYDPAVEGEDGERFAVICPTCREGDSIDDPTGHPCLTLRALAEGYGIAEEANRG